MPTPNPNPNPNPNLTPSILTDAQARAMLEKALVRSGVNDYAPVLDALEPVVEEISNRRTADIMTSTVKLFNSPHGVIETALGGASYVSEVLSNIAEILRSAPTLTEALNAAERRIRRD